MESAHYAKFLGQLPMFRGLAESEIADIVRLFRIDKTRAGETLCVEGEPGNSFFLITRGTAEVSKRTAQGDAQVLAELTGPTVVGEMALLDHAPRSASVRLSSPAEVYRIDCAEFDGLRRAFHSGAYKLIHNLALLLCGRLRETNQRIDAFFANPEQSLAEMRARQQRLWREREKARGGGAS